MDNTNKIISASSNTVTVSPGLPQQTALLLARPEFNVPLLTQLSVLNPPLNI